LPAVQCTACTHTKSEYNCIFKVTVKVKHVDGTGVGYFTAVCVLTPDHLKKCSTTLASREGTVHGGRQRNDIEKEEVLGGGYFPCRSWNHLDGLELLANVMKLSIYWPQVDILGGIMPTRSCSTQLMLMLPIAKEKISMMHVKKARRSYLDQADPQ
jgi:hypothetical protein